MLLLLNDLLRVRNLKTTIQTSAGLVQAVRDVSIDIRAGEIVGLVGESGSGKTMTALSIIGLLPAPFAKIESGEIFFEGNDLTKLSQEQMQDVRGKRISMVFQDSMTALNPTMSAGRQVVEAIQAHLKVSDEEAKAMTIDMFRSVGIPEPETRFHQYPFELSGGMRQRIMIAMALVCKPSLIIADEPTTNLDVSIQAQILELLKQIRKDTGSSILLITHNLGVVAWVCDMVYVMYGGEILEGGPVEKILNEPIHPYTTLLLKSVPRADGERARLEAIPGDVPNLVSPPKGCVFSPRCPFVVDKCRSKEPVSILLDSNHFVRCIMAENQQNKVN